MKVLIREKKSQWTIYSKTPLEQIAILCSIRIECVPVQEDPHLHVLQTAPSCPCPGRAPWMSLKRAGTSHCCVLGHSQHIFPGKLSTNDTATRRKPSAIHNNPCWPKMLWICNSCLRTSFGAQKTKGWLKAFYLTHS